MNILDRFLAMLPRGTVMRTEERGPSLWVDRDAYTLNGVREQGVAKFGPSEAAPKPAKRSPRRPDSPT